MKSLAQIVFYHTNSSSEYYKLADRILSMDDFRFAVLGIHCGPKPRNLQSYVLDLIEQCTNGYVLDADIQKPMLIEFYKKYWPKDIDLLDIVI